MNDEKENYESSHASSRIEAIDEKHSYCGDNGSSKSCLPIEEMERGTEIRRRADFEKETGEIHHQEGHLCFLSMRMKEREL